MQAEHYLAIPLLMSAETVQDAAKRWVIQLSYPELEGCTVQNERLTDALDELEDKRAALTLDLLARGLQPPTPRAPLEYMVPIMREWLAQRAAATGRGA